MRLARNMLGTLGLLVLVWAASELLAQTAGDTAIHNDLQAYAAAMTAAFQNVTNFSFGVYSDIHMIENPDSGLTRAQWASLITQWRDKGHLFGLIVGDLGYGNATDPSNVLSGPATVSGGPPVFFTMGNHELDGIGKRAWMDALYPGAVRPASWSPSSAVAPGNLDHAYYSFNIGPYTHFIVLDGDHYTFDGVTARIRQRFGQAQLAWLAADISANSDKNILLFVHEPIDQQPGGFVPDYTLNDKGSVIDLLNAHPKQSYVFSGHFHGLRGVTRWKGITSVHVMTSFAPFYGASLQYGVNVSVNGTQITVTEAGSTTEYDQFPMNQVQTVGTQQMLPVAEDGMNCGNTRSAQMTVVGAENGVAPTSGTLMLKGPAMTWYAPRFISEQLIKIRNGMKFSFDIYLVGVVNGMDAVTVQPNWYTKDGSLPPPINDQNGIKLSQRTKDGMFYLYNEDVPRLNGLATGRWYHREFDLSPLAGHYVDGVYLTSGATAVNVGGVYVDNIKFTWPPTTVNAAPTVSLTSPVEGASFTAPTTVPLAVSAADSDGTVTQVRYFSGSTLIGSSSVAPFAANWSSVPAGSYTLTAVATDNSGATTTSAAVHITVNTPTLPPPTGSSAQFQSMDTATRGNWKGMYGQEGYVIANDATSLPAYASVAVRNASSWTWAASTTDTRALQKATTGGYEAATWFGSSFAVDVTTTDGRPHKLSLYVLDWDFDGRNENIQILTPSGSVLDTRNASNFSGGQYFSWVVTGAVTIRVTLASGVNAVQSAVFLDPTVTTNAAPTVSLTSPIEGAAFAAPANIPLAATAADADGTISQVKFFAGTTLLGSVGAAPYTLGWNDVAAGTYSLSAVAVDNAGATSTSPAVRVTVTAPGGTSASFIGIDSATKGNWKGTYGTAGYAIANDATSLPAFVSVSQPGTAAWTWVSSTTDVRALQKSSGADRLAATWYGGTTNAALNFTDGVPHRVEIYVVDWDSTARTETIDVVNTATGALLDRRTASAFNNGQYFVWSLAGSVTIRITLTGGANAVYSGLFFER
jgi:Big-like domain-containing protein/calcineurin-like phosphoesterase family protein